MTSTIQTRRVVGGYLQWLSDALDELTQDEYTHALHFAVELAERHDAATAVILKEEIVRHIHSERDGARKEREG